VLPAGAAQGGGGRLLGLLGRGAFRPGGGDLPTFQFVGMNVRFGAN